MMNAISIKGNLVLTLFLSFFIMLSSCNETGDTPEIKGNLLIIGGGKRPERVMQKFVELAGGDTAKIAIIPTASRYFWDGGARLMKEFTELGAAQADTFHIRSKERANAHPTIEQLNHYSGFYFGGGDQRRLAKYFLDTRALELFHEKYKTGAVFGGTSAGAAIMSLIMITGDGTWELPMRDSVATTPGFGFIKEAVIDQHFFTRRRFNRLLNVAIQNRTAGIGIDESTAIWVQQGNQINVMGNSIVIFIDPAQAQWPGNDNSAILSAKNLRLSVFKEGDSFHL